MAWSTKTFTPLHTKDWYLKWIASVILIVGIVLTAQNVFPYNLYVSIIGLTLWLIVAIMWNDRALIVINAVSVALYANGIVSYLLKTYGG